LKLAESCSDDGKSCYTSECRESEREKYQAAKRENHRDSAVATARERDDQSHHDERRECRKREREPNMHRKNPELHVDECRQAGLWTEGVGTLSALSPAMTKEPIEHPGCTFCALIHGSAEVSICHDDADSIAFMDIQPVNHGHVLVVPREHYESLVDVPREIGMHLFHVTMRLANAVRKVSGCDDLNIVVSSGPAAGQDEPHYHVHIIPRKEGDGFDIPLPFGGSEMPDRTLLDAYAARIISTLGDPLQA
jgi:histidine triad (HIT) family protein